MPLPSSVQSIALRFTKGNPPTQLSHTQAISIESIQVGTNASNSVKVDSTFVAAFNAEQEGTIFTPSIVINYGNDESGNAITRTTNAASAFIPKVIRLADIPSKNTADAPFSIMDFLTTISTGALSYSSSVPGVATINSLGLITPVGAGTTTITANVAATATHIAGSASTTLTIVLLRIASNGVTIQYTGTASDFDANPSQPIFIQADPRNTGSNEWFAVVKQGIGMKQALINYGNGTDNTPLKRIPGDNSSLVPFNNIVTTLMTDMSFMFFHAYTFNDDVSSWDTSNVLDMNYMFHNTHAFDKPLNTWNVSKVKNMGSMFLYAYAFNKPLNSWDVSKVEDMNYMFYQATLFNQNLSGWNVTLTTTRPSLNRNDFAFGSPLALPENSNKLPPFV